MFSSHPCPFSMSTSHFKMMAKSSLTFTPNLPTKTDTYYTFVMSSHTYSVPNVLCFFSVASQSWFRLRRIWSTNETFTLRTNELIDYLYKRGYNRYFLQRKYNELKISHGQKHLCPMTLPHWTKQNVFLSLSPTTQPFVPSRPLFANTFTSLFHPHVAITSLKLHPL